MRKHNRLWLGVRCSNTRSFINVAELGLSPKAPFQSCEFQTEFFLFDFQKVSSFPEHTGKAGRGLCQFFQLSILHFKPGDIEKIA